MPYLPSVEPITSSITQQNWFDNVVLNFNGTNNFTDNSAKSSGVIAASTSLSFSGTSSFCNNFAVQGGGISAIHKSTLMFNGNCSFINNGNHINKFNNGVSHGGAMYLILSSTLSIMPHTTVCWVNNHARVEPSISLM